MKRRTAKPSKLKSKQYDKPKAPKKQRIVNPIKHKKIAGLDDWELNYE